MYKNWVYVLQCTNATRAPRRFESEMIYDNDAHSFVYPIKKYLTSLDRYYQLCHHK